MVKRVKKKSTDNSESIHKYYMDILNAMPNVVYWIDKDCVLRGCNHNFVELFGLKTLRDFSGSPYEQMGKETKWKKERIEAFRLDDMKVLFSEEPTLGIKEAPVYNPKGDALYFLSTRVPLFDNNKDCIGIVVILEDISNHKNESQTNKIETPINSSPATRTHKPHVLMVEDNFIAQKVEEALLKELDCQVDIAESGDKALQLFNPGKYDIVFMDIGLEDTSGYMVAKKLRQKEENTTFHVPIIALTSYQADVVKYDVKDYFMDGVITKPLTTEQAKQIIQRFIYHENVPVSGLQSANQAES